MEPMEIDNLEVTIANTSFESERHVRPFSQSPLPFRGLRSQRLKPDFKEGEEVLHQYNQYGGNQGRGRGRGGSGRGRGANNNAPMNLQAPKKSANERIKRGENNNAPMEIENVEVTIANTNLESERHVRPFSQSPLPFRGLRSQRLKPDFKEGEEVPYQYDQYGGNQGRGRGRGRGGRGRGRGANNNAPMNLQAPKKSANERIKRAVDPIKAEKPDEDDKNNNLMVKPLEQEANGPEFDEKQQRDQVGVDGCICLRPMLRVFCESCGFFMDGRLRKPCPIHPRDLYLYDITHCLKKGCELKYRPNMVRPRLIEFPLPKGYKTNLVNRKIGGGGD